MAEPWRPPDLAATAPGRTPARHQLDKLRRCGLALAHGQFDGLVDTGALAGLEVLAAQHDGGDEAENDEGLKDVSDHDVTPGCGGP